MTMRIKVSETPVYKYEELSDSAKENARQKWSQFLWDDGTMQENCTMIFDDMMREWGWENVDSLSYDLYGRGGEVTWSGDLPQWEYEDRTYYLRARPRSTGGSSYYMSVDVDATWEDQDTDDIPGVDEIERIEEAAKDMIRDRQHELMELFRKEDEYQSSDEMVAEAAEANGYEYTEDGDLA